MLNSLEMVFAGHHSKLARETLKHDADYQKRVQQQAQTFNEIANKLGDKNRKLMPRLEDLRNGIEADEMDLVYLQGYIDCVALLRLIKII